MKFPGLKATMQPDGSFVEVKVDIPPPPDNSHLFTEKNEFMASAHEWEGPR